MWIWNLDVSNSDCFYLCNSRDRSFWRVIILSKELKLRLFIIDILTLSLYPICIIGWLTLIMGTSFGDLYFSLWEGIRSFLFLL